MYNPTRNTKSKKARLRRQNPHAGTKHSDIVKRNGVGGNAPVSQVLVHSLHGRESSIFSCDNFEVRYELFLAGNSSGYGVNEKGDRTIRVLRGTLFVTFEAMNGEKITKRIAPGAHLHAPAGMKHMFATSGTEDAELLFIETPDYRDDWQQLEDPVINKVNQPVLSSPEAAIPARRKSTKAYEQAANAAARKGRRRGKGPKVVSPQTALAATGAQAAVTGLNPQPMRFSEE